MEALDNCAAVVHKLTVQPKVIHRSQIWPSKSPPHSHSKGEARHTAGPPDLQETTMTSFVRPCTDAAFKHIFADPTDTTPLRSFLAAILG